jgi:hypothetical protein
MHGEPEPRDPTSAASLVPWPLRLRSFSFHDGGFRACEVRENCDRPAHDRERQGVEIGVCRYDVRAVRAGRAARGDARARDRQGGAPARARGRSRGSGCRASVLN